MIAKNQVGMFPKIIGPVFCKRENLRPEDKFPLTADMRLCYSECVGARYAAHFFAPSHPQEQPSRSSKTLLTEYVGNFHPGAKLVPSPGGKVARRAG